MTTASRFRYKALTASGRVLTGATEAVSAAAVIDWLRGQGHYPLLAVEQTRRGWLPDGMASAAQPRPEDLAFACRSLALLLQAGLGLERSLDLLAGFGELRRLRPTLQSVLARLRDGGGLADALAGEPRLPRLLVAMVRAGEMSGRLEAALTRLADHMARAAALKQSVVSALVYPTILLVTGTLSVTVILVFVLPEFVPLFESAGKDLPWSTRVVMGVGDGVRDLGLAAILAMAAAAVGWRSALRRPGIRLRWDRAMLDLPVVGTLLLELEVERFARTLGTLLGGGITLPTALAMTRDAVGNAAVAKAVGDAAVGLREGQALAERLAHSGVFPALALDLIRVGEETSRLDEMLLHQADLAERNVRVRVDRLLAMLVPALTLMLGAVVAVIVASLAAALFGINDLTAT